MVEFVRVNLMMATSKESRVPMIRYSYLTNFAGRNAIDILCLQWLLSTTADTLTCKLLMVFGLVSYNEQTSAAIMHGRLDTYAK